MERLVPEVYTTSLSFRPDACPGGEGCAAAHAGLRHNVSVRTALLAELIKHVANAPYDGHKVLLTPAGLFADAGPANLAAYARVVQELIADGNTNICVAFGVDGNTGGRELDSPDQLMLAVTSAGVLGAARKANPAPGERNVIPFGDPGVTTWIDGVDHGRTFDFGCCRFSLAVCYDGLGPQQRNWVRPAKLDAVLNGIHWFFRKCILRPSGDFCFARGLASASSAWRVPVYASAAFICREVVEGFPNGIMAHPWPQGVATKKWRYKYNHIGPNDETWLGSNVLVRRFHI